jgi:hypothetical protein
MTQEQNTWQLELRRQFSGTVIEVDPVPEERIKYSRVIQLEARNHDDKAQ